VLNGDLTDCLSRGKSLVPAGNMSTIPQSSLCWLCYSITK